MASPRSRPPENRVPTPDFDVPSTLSLDDVPLDDGLLHVCDDPSSDSNELFDMTRSNGGGLRVFSPTTFDMKNECALGLKASIPFETPTDTEVITSPQSTRPSQPILSDDALRDFSGTLPIFEPAGCEQGVIDSFVQPLETTKEPHNSVTPEPHDETKVDVKKENIGVEGTNTSKTSSHQQQRLNGNHGSARSSYKCGKCGKEKFGHVCLSLGEIELRSCSSQVELSSNKSVLLNGADDPPPRVLTVGYKSFQTGSHGKRIQNSRSSIGNWEAPVIRGIISGERGADGLPIAAASAGGALSASSGEQKFEAGRNAGPPPMDGAVDENDIAAGVAAGLYINPPLNRMAHAGLAPPPSLWLKGRPDLVENKGNRARARGESESALKSSWNINNVRLTRVKQQPLRARANSWADSCGAGVGVRSGRKGGGGATPLKRCDSGGTLKRCDSWGEGWGASSPRTMKRPRADSLPPAAAAGANSLPPAAAAGANSLPPAAAAGANSLPPAAAARANSLPPAAVAAARSGLVGLPVARPSSAASSASVSSSFSGTASAPPYLPPSPLMVRAGVAPPTPVVRLSASQREVLGLTAGGVSAALESGDPALFAGGRTAMRLLLAERLASGPPSPRSADAVAGVSQIRASSHSRVKRLAPAPSRDGAPSMPVQARGRSLSLVPIAPSFE